MASTAARNRGHETPGACGRALFAQQRGAFAPEPAARPVMEARPWADNATVERREAASRLRGRAHASQAWRRALPARHVQGWSLPALRPPLGGGSCCEEDARDPHAATRRGNGEVLHGKRTPRRRHPRLSCLTL